METGGRLETAHPWGQLKVPVLLPHSLTFPPAGFPSNIHPIAPSLPPFMSLCFCLLPIKYCFSSRPSPLPWSLAHSQPLGLQAPGPLHGAPSPCAWPLFSLFCTHPQRGGGEAPSPHRPHHCHHQRCWPTTDPRVRFPSSSSLWSTPGWRPHPLVSPPDSLLNLFCSFSFPWPRVQALMTAVASSAFSSLLLPACHPCHPPNHSIHPSCRDQSHFLKQNWLSLPADNPASLPSTSRVESLPLASPPRPFRADLHLPFHVHPTVHLMHPTPSPGGKVAHFPSAPSPLGPPLPSNALFPLRGSPFFSLPPHLPIPFTRSRLSVSSLTMIFLTFSGVKMKPLWLRV